MSVLEDTFDKTLVGTSISLWLEAIHNESKAFTSSLDDGDRDNLMYNHQFVAYFIDLLHLLPLWSAICCPFFPGSEPIASSGNVESHIKVVKQSMEQLIPCSVDRFVQENMNMNAGLIIEASQSYIKFISNPETMEFDFTNAASQPLLDTEKAGPETSENSLLEGTTINEILSEEDHSIVENRTKITGISQPQIIDREQENEDISFEENVDVGEKMSTVEDLSCPACKNKNWPSGAHKCIICGKNVHILSGCSVSIGSSEGYGEKRVCVLCDSRRRKQENDKIIEVNHTEKWCRTSKRQIKKSKYRMPVPNWNLNHHFDKNVKIGFLTNGNMSLRVFGTKNNFVGLKNTCSFDVLAQVSGNLH